jgi:hypothetical protein
LRGPTGKPLPEGPDHLLDVLIHFSVVVENYNKNNKRVKKKTQAENHLILKIINRVLNFDTGTS